MSGTRAEPAVTPRGYLGPVTGDPLLPDLQQALAGRYVLERRLGRGGMGVVYLARELRLDRRVAIKLLPPDRAVQPDARDLFLHEARTAARLSHPGIVPIFAVHEVRDFVFFVMAYIEGETLGQRVRDGGPLRPPAAGRVLEEVARALAYAHARGVVHRDVKPDNILLDRTTGRALVTDFGIARVDAGISSASRRVVGTAEFMSPEQAVGGPVDARSDLYSLGVVGFFTLSGTLPFQASDAMAVLARHVADPPPPLASVAPGIPRRLAEAIDRCLAKRPDARFADGAALAEAVGAALDRRAAVAVRAFLTEARHLSPTMLFYGAVAGVVVPLLTMRFLELADPRARVATAVAAAVIVLVPVAITARRVRRLVKEGYRREDLVDALRAELAHRREELAFLYGDGPSRLERTLRRVAYVSVAAAGAVVGALERFPGALDVTAARWLFGVAAATALLAAAFARWRTEHRTDLTAERRLRFWSGPLGKWLFSLAAQGPGPRSQPQSDVIPMSPVPAITPVPGGGGPDA
ncbi:MAG TPA: serine/threonine-protein kinase [Gemmatimonadales bacterium]|nr:serine/threonine-protein kinase [Gemmatimonadales bacterium]